MNEFRDAMGGDTDRSGLSSASLLAGIAQDLYDGNAAGQAKADLVRLAHARRGKAWAHLLAGLPQQGEIKNWVRECFLNDKGEGQHQDVTGAWKYLLAT
jgi:hypothetical protein